MRSVRSIVGTALLAVIWSGYAPGASAQEGASTLDALESRVSALEKNAGKGQATAGPKGFALTSEDKTFELKLRGYIQADARFFVDDSDEKLTDTFLLRRVRPILEGKVGEDWAFRIMPDFGGGKSEIVDAYIDYSANKAFQVRGGKFKPPFSLERLQSGTALRLTERGYPSSLGPNRDAGLQISGEPWNGIQYALGVFNGVADGSSGDVDSEDGKDFVGRLWLEPFKASDVAPLKGLGFGVAGSIGDVEGSASSSGLSSYKSIGQSTIFSFRSSTNSAETAYADGERVRYSPQLTYYWGPFGLLAEYVESSHEVRKGEESATLENEAWQVVASWVLTGEDNSYKLIKPKKPFDPSKGQWGAFELVGRATSIDFDDDAFPVYSDPKKSVSSADTLGVGLNWYLTDNIKASIDYENTSFDGGATAGDRPDEQLVFARWQVSF